MIPQDTLDVASTLAAAIDDPGTVLASHARRVSGLVPERSLFTVTTVEGRRFRVTVTPDTP